MNRRAYFVLVAALLLNGASVNSAAEEAGNTTINGPAITIRVYDYVGVPELVNRRARATTGRIFRIAGSTVEWTDCPTSAEKPPGDARCNVLAGPSDIRLNILTEEMAKKTKTSRRDFGAAYPLPEGFGRLASVFYDRVKHFATDRGRSTGRLLGHVIAHEIGHLLLGVKSHSEGGIMHVPWSRNQIERAGHGWLLFSQADAERIRDQMRARYLASRTQPDAGSPKTRTLAEVTPGDRSRDNAAAAIADASPDSERFTTTVADSGYR